MISDFDDYPIHQTPEPVAQPGTTDFNFYDRYWFIGASEQEGLVFGLTLGLYPNRRVMDASFSVVIDGVQHSFHGSRLAPLARNRTAVGPFRLEVIRPMKIAHAVLEPNETGMSCDLTFTARTAPIEEPRSVMKRQDRIIMDTARFAQFGRWQGWIEIAGKRIQIDPKRVLGTRDRSWGVRPVGERDAGIGASYIPQVFWVWAPIHFDKFCTHYGAFEDEEGKQTQASGYMVPTYDKVDDIPEGSDIEVTEMASVAEKLHCHPGTRLAKKAEITLVEKNGSKHVISVECLHRIYTLGMGYIHPEWAHGMWKGDLKIAGESWRIADIDPKDYRFQHIEHVCRAKMGDQVGLGTLEQLSFGAHKPSAFVGFLEVETK
jgi:hypothetical protein